MGSTAFLYNFSTEGSDKNSGPKCVIIPCLAKMLQNYFCTAVVVQPFLGVAKMPE
jgi:hypothetical protein